MSMTRIEFRCSDEERKQIEEHAKKAKLTTGRYIIRETLYGRRKGRNRLKAEDRESICRICTYLNKISDGIEIEESKEEMIKECKKLCRYSK